MGAGNAIRWALACAMAGFLLSCSASPEDTRARTDDSGAKPDGGDASVSAASSSRATLVWQLGTEDCCVSHISPGCFTQHVQQCVCARAESCCSGLWTDACVVVAQDWCAACVRRLPASAVLVAGNQGGVSGYCAFNGGQAGAGGLLIGLLSLGGLFSRRAARGRLHQAEV